MLSRVLLVALGGSIGAAARYILSGWVARLSRFATFPFGTLVVNVSGAFLLGALMGMTTEGRFLTSPNVRNLLAIGILGGYTTFSTFSYETLEALRFGDARAALVNVIATLVAGLFACWLGLRLGEQL